MALSRVGGGRNDLAHRFCWSIFCTLMSDYIDIYELESGLTIPLEGNHLGSHQAQTNLFKCCQHGFCLSICAID